MNLYWRRSLPRMFFFHTCLYTSTNQKHLSWIWWCWNFRYCLCLFRFLHPSIWQRNRRCQSFVQKAVGISICNISSLLPADILVSIKMAASVGRMPCGYELCFHQFRRAVYKKINDWCRIVFFESNQNFLLSFEITLFLCLYL